MIVSARVVLLILCAMAMACSDAEAPRSDPAPPPDPAPPATDPTEPSPGPTDADPSNQDANQTPPTDKPATSGEDDSQALVDRGRAVYTANCIACHNPEPSLDGGIGPAVGGASLELLEARIMRNEYPPGYTPKRDTKAMIPLPYLEKDLPALAAYLAQ